MPLSATAKNRQTFEKLLTLSAAQIAALESDDMPKFDRILQEKHVVIGMLGGAREMIDADPSLQSLANRINASEETAQRLLFARIGEIRRELGDLRRQGKVRAAYASSTPMTARAQMMNARGTARFMDQKL
ncbi:MAG: hypothetical protein JWQ02_382 [Capsulimonas sp.]|jgi:methylphosphotriester-DNA--protein-cysteine methyltransferase|nr:hypothetical protein [Capsulimonas sp.]